MATTSPTPVNPAPMPRTIHYCWFGRGPMPAKALKCIESWKKFCPDYKIVEWNEDNYDVSAHRYTDDAYAAGDYAFVSDYARFDILYNHGGVYFDTDVEVIRNIDDLVGRGPFMGCEKDAPGLTVAPGLVVASPPGFGLFRSILNDYDRIPYAVNGVRTPGTVVKRVTDTLVDLGLDRDKPGIQTVCGLTVYPAEFFAPYDDLTGRLDITRNTRSIHWYSKLWIAPAERRRTRYTRIFHRLFGVNCFAFLRRLLRMD